MVILRKGIVLVLTVFCACSAAQAAEPDWNRLIEFRDTVAPGSYEEAILERSS